jgi:hypothetical protein
MGCSNLEILDLGTFASDKLSGDLPFLADCEKLTTLRLGGCNSITEQGQQRLSALGNVSRVRLANVSSMSLKFLSSLENLRHLWIGSCQSLSDTQTLANLQQIRSIEFIACPSIDTNAVAAMSTLPYLEKLNLSACRNVTDTALTALVKLNNLRELDISNNMRLTFIGVQILATLPKLRTIRVSGSIDYQFRRALRSLYPDRQWL